MTLKNISIKVNKEAYDDKEYIEIDLKVHGKVVAGLSLVYNADTITDKDCDEDEWALFHYARPSADGDDMGNGDIIAQDNVPPLKIKK